MITSTPTHLQGNDIFQSQIGITVNSVTSTGTFSSNNVYDADDYGILLNNGTSIQVFLLTLMLRRLFPRVMKLLEMVVGQFII